MGWLSSVFQAVAPVVGDVLGFSADKKANKQALRQAEADRAYQKELNQNQIQWRVADAQKAGIHPLFALGATGMGYSPPAVVDGVGGDSFRNMGQDISRATGALMTQRERRAAVAAAAFRDRQEAIQREVQRERESVLFDQQVRMNEIEMQYRASQVARLNAPGTGVPDENAPPGSSYSLPDMVTVGDKNAPERSPGIITDYSLGRTASGGYSLTPSMDIKNRVEDTPMEWQWLWRNGMPPRAVYDDLEARQPARPGYIWQYDFMRGEFREVPRSDLGRNLWEFFIRPDLYGR